MRISVGAACADRETTSSKAKVDAGPFDRAAAARALSISVASCKAAAGPTGRGHAKVTFQPSGEPSAAELEAPYAGTAVGACVAQRYLSVRIPSFAGAPVNVGKTFSID